MSNARELSEIAAAISVDGSGTVTATAFAGEFGEIQPFVEPILPTIDFEPTPTNPV